MTEYNIVSTITQLKTEIVESEKMYAFHYSADATLGTIWMRAEDSLRITDCSESTRFLNLSVYTWH